MHLVILAGGKGTRLGRADVPKPMVPVAGKPVLQRTLEWAARSGLRDVTIISHHQAQVIVDAFGDGSAMGLRIRHVIEDEPRGTAGAVRLLKGELTERFMVVFGDLILDFDAARFMAFDATSPSLGTVLVHPNGHPHESDLVEVGEDSVITAMHPKPHPPGVAYQNLVNAAVFILDPSVIDAIPADAPCDFGRELLPAIVREGGRMRAYNTWEYVSDMGTPERVAKVERDLASGKVAARHASRRQRAIFLDRDGVLNPDESPITRPEHLTLYPGVAEAVKAINKSAYLAVVITNQPGIAKGFLTEDDLAAIHRKLEWDLAAAGGAFIEGLYHCPHHPERGWPGEVEALKIQCDCRKPAPGLFHRAARDLNLDLSACFMIGDRAVDMEAAAAAGVTGIRVEPGQDLRPIVASILTSVPTP